MIRDVLATIAALAVIIATLVLSGMLVYHGLQTTDEFTRVTIFIFTWVGMLTVGVGLLMLILEKFDVRRPH